MPKEERFKQENRQKTIAYLTHDRGKEGIEEAMNMILSEFDVLESRIAKLEQKK